ncbi:hypothetical protein PFISCL1PPCAC_12929, partial [Pristionchus fissidentatus]
FSTQKYIAIFSLLTIHPIILLILFSKKCVMSRPIKYGYAFEQLSLVLNEVIFSFLSRPYPLFPYSGLYCDGPICRSAMSRSIFMYFIAFSIVVDVPSIAVLIMQMHSNIMERTRSRFKLSAKMQVAVMICCYFLLTLNLIGFGHFSVDSDNYYELAQKPEMTQVIARGGMHIIFGGPGDLGKFQ